MRKAELIEVNLPLVRSKTLFLILSCFVILFCVFFVIVVVLF